MDIVARPDLTAALDDLMQHSTDQDARMGGLKALVKGHRAAIRLTLAPGLCAGMNHGGVLLEKAAKMKILSGNGTILTGQAIYYSIAAAPAVSADEDYRINLDIRVQETSADHPRLGNAVMAEKTLSFLNGDCRLLSRDTEPDGSEHSVYVAASF